VTDTAPFFDPELVVAALQPLVPGTVWSVLQLASVGRADQAQGLRPAPGIIVVPERCAVSGPGGLGNDRTITETIGLVIQVRDVGARDHLAEDAVHGIRLAVWDLLEGKQLHARWSPLRYAGGEIVQLDDGFYSWVERYLTERPAPTRPRT
jgi:hypothetical protein